MRIYSAAPFGANTTRSQSLLIFLNLCQVCRISRKLSELKNVRKNCFNLLAKVWQEKKLGIREFRGQGE